MRVIDARKEKVSVLTAGAHMAVEERERARVGCCWAVLRARAREKKGEGIGLAQERGRDWLGWAFLLFFVQTLFPFFFKTKQT